MYADRLAYNDPLFIPICLGFRTASFIGFVLSCNIAIHINVSLNFKSVPFQPSFIINLRWTSLSLQKGICNHNCSHTTVEELHLNHGEHVGEFNEEPHRQEGDEDLDGGARCCWKNNNPLQAQTGGNSHNHPNHW